MAPRCFRRHPTQASDGASQLTEPPQRLSAGVDSRGLVRFEDHLNRCATKHPRRFVVRASGAGCSDRPAAPQPGAGREGVSSPAVRQCGVAVGSEGEPSYRVELCSTAQASLCLFQTDEKPAHLHLAFVADNRGRWMPSTVQDLRAGGKDNGGPGLRLPRAGALMASAQPVSSDRQRRDPPATSASCAG